MDHDTLADDTLLPAQFNDLLRRTRARSPEQKLMLAVLEDALACWMRAATLPSLHSYRPGDPPYGQWSANRRERDHEEAHHWMFDDDSNYPALKFVGVCDELDIDPTWLRECLIRWQQNNTDHGLGPRENPRRGVSFTRHSPKGRPWFVRISVDGKLHHVGYFATFEEARDAYAAALPVRASKKVN